MELTNLSSRIGGAGKAAAISCALLGYGMYSKRSFAQIYSDCSGIQDSLTIAANEVCTGYGSAFVGVTENAGAVRILTQGYSASSTTGVFRNDGSIDFSVGGGGSSGYHIHYNHGVFENRGDVRFSVSSTSGVYFYNTRSGLVNNFGDFQLDSYPIYNSGVFTNRGAITGEGRVLVNDGVFTQRTGGAIKHISNRGLAEIFSNASPLESFSNGSAAILRSRASVSLSDSNINHGLLSTELLTVNGGAEITGDGILELSGSTIINGEVSQKYVQISGVLAGSGILRAEIPIEVDRGLLLKADDGGANVGPLTISADVDFQTSIFSIEFDSVDDFELLKVEGVLDFTSANQKRLSFSFSDSFFDGINGGERLSFVEAEAILNFSDVITTFVNIADGFEVDFLTTSSSMDLVFAKNVPVPGAAWLFGSALVAMAVSRRRTRKE